MLHHLDPLRLAPQQGSQKPAKGTLLSRLMLLLEATLMTDSKAGTAPADC